MQKRVKLKQLKPQEKYPSATTLFLRKCSFFRIKIFLVVYFEVPKKFIFQEYLVEYILIELKCNILAFSFSMELCSCFVCLCYECILL